MTSPDQDCPPKTKQKLLFSSTNWALVEIPTPASSSKTNFKSHELRRPERLKRSQAITFSSGLSIRCEMDSKEYEYYKNVSKQPPSGYTMENSGQALIRFAKRGIIEIVSTYLVKSASDRYIAQIEVNVCDLLIRNAKFTAEDYTREKAKQACALKILNSLYANSAIKEAGVEFHKRRKAFMDSSKDLDVKLQGYLSSDASVFAEILDNIAKKKELFY